MTEAAGLIHVKRHGFRVRLRIVVKEEGGFVIDKSPDQPGRGDTINPRPWTGDPGTVLIFHFGYPALPSSLRRGHGMLCLIEGFSGFCLERTFKKINLFNFFKPSFQSR